ncbi:MAG: peptide chain release factor N(5)-glutamine methyltransferase [Microbacteriaceae bacterium]
MNNLLTTASNRLAEAGVPSPGVDAELLLGAVLELGRGELQAAIIRGLIVNDNQRAIFDAFIERRVAREPLQHILGVAHFRQLSLSVGPGVFVPRPETELLVELALERLRSLDAESPLVIDFGTGSGAIALSIATEHPKARVLAVEKSVDAHRWAEKNFASIAPQNAILLLGDLFDQNPGSTLATLLEQYRSQLSLVVSNPPYIPLEAVPRDPEVRLFDPELALYSGNDGFDAIRRLSQIGLELLVPGGQLLMEHGEEQAADIATILRQDGWAEISCKQDLTSRDRFTVSTKLG